MARTNLNVVAASVLTPGAATAIFKDMSSRYSHTTECIELAALRIWDNNSEADIPTWAAAVQTANAYLDAGISECTCEKT